MIALKRLTVLLSLSACAGLALGEQAPSVQDGIEVKPLSRWRNLQDQQEVDQQAQSQYAEMMDEAQQKGALVDAAHPQVKRLRAIAARLTPYAPRWNEQSAQWKWEVNLLNSPQVNAFCMPGGRIAFYSGILTTLKLSDDEVAVVMGHEIAHALREHGRAQAAKTNATSIGSRLLGAGAAALFGVDPRITGTVADMAAKGLSLHYSRDDEREADLVGLDLAARAGFDPRAGIVLWQKMGSLNKSAPPAFMSTHPSGADRIDIMQSHMGQVLPLYARSKGVSVEKLPAYRSSAIASK
ncbi:MULTISPECIES: M48 family metallopeptidase [unclassified Janthinobacterium]|uniref:M48 family metallopeptidase n=1 Tax=unclassified Janthinobacterium TaxID=2610881 RepID=UPI0003483B17|nr:MULTISPECIES: M48 family metallopeptidase [unclassified Janthinobacterium]MEC5163575.1 Zn-dependent protease with chaperone function [Janthinobacterium sp. CG_S6]